MKHKMHLLTSFWCVIQLAFYQNYQRISLQWNWCTTDAVNSKQVDVSRRNNRRLGQHQKLRPTNMMINFISRRSTFIDIVAAVSTPRCLISCWTIVDLVTTIASFIRVQWRLDVRRLQTKLTITITKHCGRNFETSRWKMFDIQRSSNYDKS